MRALIEILDTFSGHLDKIVNTRFFIDEELVDIEFLENEMYMRIEVNDED